MKQSSTTIFMFLLMTVLMVPLFGEIISLQSLANNLYVCADNYGNNPLIANRTSVSTWEQFNMISNSDGTISLIALANGKYVCADNAGALPLIANKTAIGTWEKFRRINNSDGTVSFIALANNKYVCADNAGASPLIANRTAIGTWEKFRLSSSTAATPVPATTTPTPTTAPAGSYYLVWADEFSASTVNTSYWSYEVGGGGWGNNELQYYTNGLNSRIESGMLVIEARKESYSGYSYTSSRMITYGKKQYTYGKIEGRIKVPYGQGLWPAFWMLGTNIKTGTVWPACGEIDIMEHINTEGDIHGTIHWDAGGYVSYGTSVVCNAADYRVYAIEWDSSAIRWYVDGAKYLEANILNSINSTEEFHKPFFVLLNLAVGGNWPGAPNSSTVFPARMYIDYVRWYQK